MCQVRQVAKKASQKSNQTRAISSSRHVAAPKVLVLAEHDGSKLTAATLHTVQAAHTIQAKSSTKDAASTVDLLLVTPSASKDSLAALAASVEGVNNVYVASDASLEHPVAEQIVSIVEQRQKGGQYSHILAAASSTGKNVIPRLAASFDVQPISDILVVQSDDTFTRPIYAGNALQTVKSTDALKLITVRTTAFTKAAATGGKAATHTEPVQTPSNSAKWESAQVASSERPELTSARVVISGGRGLQNGDNFKLLYSLADKIGTGRDAAVGASRAAVDAGFVPNDMQVGQTGKIVAPELYVAVGISGAIQHLAGMKDSKVIVAINKDEEAPIFQVADYGLVADLFQAVPELTQKIEASKK
jgi:electron transfer flavoprotein alpha subunit